MKRFILALTLGLVGGVAAQEVGRVEVTLEKHATASEVVQAVKDRIAEDASRAKEVIKEYIDALEHSHFAEKVKAEIRAALEKLHDATK